MIDQNKIDEILKKFDLMQNNLNEEKDSEKYVLLSKQFSDFSPIAKAAKVLNDLYLEIESLDEILEDDQSEEEFKKLAENEKHQIKDNILENQTKLSILLLPKDEADSRNVILEVRAGTGGDEAAMFGADLFRMYQRYSDINSWKFEIMNLSENSIGGLKEASANISGKNVFSKLKFESGVHRVQRVPITESSGRIHTSAATVAVLPEAEDVDVNIEDKDIRIDVFRASGPGGQSVNTTDSAVRITHLPSGIVVTQQDEKSQHKNKSKALKILRARLFEVERSKINSERAEARRSQVGTGDRSERIRTYNFPQNRLTDHRVNLTIHKLDRILTGELLNEVINELILVDQEERLKNLS
ncbi:MAG: peptide chain release factor 1 [Rhodospirillaceae bacterium]|nr:peptide chain release factor 1 [Rhodospirillaceae bacterium]|tara:strand:- start:9314 stop:10384 length:1071 start_codon:yes stop_codon:yes gene_type:complete